MMEMADALGERPVAISLPEFLEKKPAYVRFEISEPKLVVEQKSAWGDLALPTLYLWCKNEGCTGLRYFDPSEYSSSKSIKLKIWKETFGFLEYSCRNCGTTRKTYAVVFEYDSKESRLSAAKFGELPPFSPHLPSRLRKLIGPDQDKIQQGAAFRGPRLGSWSLRVLSPGRRKPEGSTDRRNYQCCQSWKPSA
jgi:hypothetical protein